MILQNADGRVELRSIECEILPSCGNVSHLQPLETL